jgi:hypothetical protein
MSQDIEIDPDSRTITYYEKPTVESIKEHLDAGGLAIGVGQARALLDEIDRLRKLVPPESERGPGFVGQGSWSVFAEKVVAERDEARDDLNTLCEDIRVLKEEYDDFKSEADERIQTLIKDNRAFADENAALADDNRCLHEKVKRLEERLAAKKEHANCHYGDKFEFNGIDGYGNFSLKRVEKDRWEIQLLKEKVTLYNKKGHRVRGDHNYDGDW